MTDLLTALRSTRAGYDVECTWHRFLVDAYTGSGGFLGSIRQPAAGYWGAAAGGYGSRSTEGLRDELTYLDRYGREDEDKFKRRREVAHYLNYVAPLTDIKISYLLSKPPTRESAPDVVEEWRQNVDGRGTTWDELWLLATYRAAICGWIPILVDAPSSDGVATRAQAIEAGVRPKAFVLWPSALLAFKVDAGGTFEWAKIRTVHTEQETALATPHEVETITIWTAADATVYRISKIDGKESVSGPDVRPHGFGVVPIAVYRNKPALSDDEVLGIPMHGDVSIEARRLFNLLSEFDEHLRSQVFALLQVPTDAPLKDGELTIGTDNALPIRSDSQQGYAYIAPPASVAATYETRIEATIREIYRMGRVEYTRGAGGPASGVARRYEFASTNRAIGDFAAQSAKAESWVDDIVGRFLSVSDDARRAARVSAQTDFDIGDLESDIKATLDAVSAQLGATATKLLRRRLIGRMLPNLPKTTAEEIDAELDAQADDDAVGKAMAAEMLDAETADEEAAADEETDGATGPGRSPGAAGGTSKGVAGGGAPRGSSRQDPREAAR
jgi:hypothetical protein